MDKKKYRRVNFRISHCSSQDPDYPVSQLLLQSPNAKGWLSKRFCQYPQTIVYELVEPTIIKQISVLSHQSKISTKIVIHNKVEQNKEWSRLGYLSLESNVNSNYQARELKTVNIHDKPSLFLRFSFEANYVNNHNIFNQVGVISLCIFGDKMSGGGDPEKPAQQFNGEFDKNTTAKLKMLELQKKAALDNEDYDKAQSIKNEIERIKNLGNTLMMLQEKKKRAVQNQDYEDAKVINEKIKKLRDAEGGGPNFSTRPSGTPSDYFRPKKTTYDEQPQEEEEPSISPTTYQKPQQRAPVQHKSPPKKVAEDNIFERPIQVKNQNPYENADQEDPQEAQGNQPGGVQPLSKEIRAECMQHFSVLDEQIFMHLFSSHHANRERGLNMVKDEIMDNGKNKQQMAQAFLYVVKKMIDDKNVAVLLAAIDVFGLGMKKLRPPPGNNFSSMAEFILQKMNDYLGHSNQKVKRVTEDVYMNLPAFPLTNKDVCYNILTAIGKRDKPPKIVAGRLKTIEAIVSNFQLGKNYDGVIKFAIKYADDKNAEVRNAAISLICAISNQIGFASMQPFLKNLRPQIVKSIEDKFQQMGGRDDRDHQEQVLPAQRKKGAQQIPIKKAREEFEEAQNEFIEVPAKKKVDNSEYVCEFCGRFDKKFQDENYRDMHLFNACPMLMICEECKQAVEVSAHTGHQIGECKNSKYYKRCPRCKEAVHQKQYKAHVERKQCVPAKPMAVANRCPLCHLDIEPGQDGWRQHLAEEGCENNPRK